MDQAIDPKTGKINWDCPCMGNNPRGPCAGLFKRAFEYFVKNPDLPEKCFHKMQLMHNCQAKYPRLYNDDETNNNINN